MSSDFVPIHPYVTDHVVVGIGMFWLSVDIPFNIDNDQVSGIMWLSKPTQKTQTGLRTIRKPSGCGQSRRKDATTFKMAGSLMDERELSTTSKAARRIHSLPQVITVTRAETSHSRNCDPFWRKDGLSQNRGHWVSFSSYIPCCY